jgi:hypothetical protein
MLGVDIVVTVPKNLWKMWLEEGDLPGEIPSEDYWSYYTGGAMPGRIILTGARWNAKSFHPTELEGSPGTELVWSNLADDNREWHIAAEGQRCYVVAHGLLRGYAPLFAIETDETGRELKAFIRRAGAVAVTIPTPIPGFRGWRYRWWEMSQETPFPDWQTAGVPDA